MSQRYPGQGQWSSGGWGQPGGQPGFGRGYGPAPGFGPQGWQQQPPWPQPAWPAPGPGFPPPPRRPGLAPVFLGAAGVVLLIIVGLVVYSQLREPDYQNEDYVPPPPGNVKPLPDAPVSEVDTLLTANELYAQPLATPIRCELSNPDMQVLAATDAEVKAYIDELMACTMRVWDQPFRGTNRFELVRPVVNVYDRVATSPCGTSEGPNAFYCPANQEVYYARELPRALPSQARPHVIDGVMAHEFGHAMQTRTLISAATRYRQRQVDEATALELNRRLELQADCFAGMYMQAVTESVGYDQQNVDDVIESFRLIAGDVQRGRPGDPGLVDDHGQGQSRQYWVQVGLTSTDLNRCNTYTAPSEYVR